MSTVRGETFTAEVGEESAHQRAVEICQEALADHEGKFPDALAQARDRIELDPDLILAVVGPVAWPRAIGEFLQVIVAHNASIQLNKAKENLNNIHRPRRPKKPPTFTPEYGLLRSMKVAGKMLAFCTKAELVAEAQRRSIKARFLEAIAAKLPTDEALVMHHVTPKDAQALHDAAAKVA